MALQERPICFHFNCAEPISRNDEIVFEAPCGHLECPSAAFHGVCLMEFREHREHILEEARRFVEAHLNDPDEPNPEDN